MLKSLIISLIATIIIEVIISSIIGIRNKKDLLVIILANICTNPIVVYIANIVSLLNIIWIYWSVVLLVEVIVVLVEWKIYDDCIKNKKVNSLSLSLINNISSFGIRRNFNKFINYRRNVNEK